MRNSFIISILIFLPVLSYSAKADMKMSVSLDSSWTFRQYHLGEWLPATVPGCIHTDLLANQKIEDPFYRTNESALQWIDKVNWEYKHVFEVADSVYAKTNKCLTFYGLDTYANIYLNGQKLGYTDNMFRTWKYDVKDQLKKGRNELRIVFFSPIVKGLQEMENYGLRLPADNDQSILGGMGTNRVSVYTRKAPYNYGWDWGPRLVTSGIWRPVILEAWNDIQIEGIFIRQLKVDKRLAQLNAEITLASDSNSLATIEISHKNKIISKQSVNFKPGVHRVGLPINIRNPHLWWSNGLGTPYLYTFDVKIKKANRLVAFRQVTTGLRNIRLVRHKDDRGETFYFELNGVPVFAKGANYIPNDAFLSRVSRTDYEKVVSDAADAHMNMLRVWGGGTYEDDYFYELCDQKGIMVWQDCMFACAMYPGNPEFLENVRQEITDNVIRLRNHPCMALWCGNNEIGVAWRHGSAGGWGWKQKYIESQQEKIFKAYTDIFHIIVPEIIEKYSDGIAYWPSSPMAGTGKFDFEQQPGKSGDNHYWGVWHGKHRLEEFADNIGRFVSEYGFQSFPEFETVKQYTLPEDYNIESDVMASHQRSGIGNLRIREYMDWYYKVPEDFEQFLYMSQVLQARAMKTALQVHRSAMPYCMGSLVWQLNDCWPVASWSTTDYYHRWKAAHYAIREACKPVMVVPALKSGRLELKVVSDRLKKINGTYSVVLLDFDGNSLNTTEGKFTVGPNRSALIAKIPQSVLQKQYAPEETLAVITLREGNKVLDEQHYYFKIPKELRLPQHPQITIHPENRNGKKFITVQTDKLACDVMFYVPGQSVQFSDNYIDLLPNRTYTIEYTGDDISNVQTRRVE